MAKQVTELLAESAAGEARLVGENWAAPGQAGRTRVVCGLKEGGVWARAGEAWARLQTVPQTCLSSCAVMSSLDKST